MADTRTDEQKGKDCEKIFSILEQIRLPYEAMIDEILTYVNHSRRKISDKDAPKGATTGISVYDGTPLSALNLLADGLHGYLVSPSIRWFSFTLPGKLNFPRYSGMRSWDGKRMDEYPEVKEWLESCEEVLYSAFLRSNFYEQTPEVFRDGGSVGTVTTYVEEDVPAGRIIFTVPHFRECYIAENRFGMVDTTYRLFKMTLRQIQDKFGEARMIELLPSWKLDMEKNPYDEREVLHCVYPRSDYEQTKVDALNKPVASYWFLRSPIKFIREGGYNENPVITWRWRKNNDELYGRSPAWDSYVDIMTGQEQGKTNLVAAHKMVDPAMMGPADLRGKVNKGPGGWTWVKNYTKEMLPQPLIQKVELPFGIDAQERTDKKIREHFHTDFFLMLSQAAFQNVDITATQVIEMQGEKAAILGTRIGRLQSEFLNPVIDRVFAVEMRAGRISPPPDILFEFAGANIEVDYLGPLAQAQKRLFKAQGILGGVTALMPLAQIAPEAMDVVDVDETARELLESRGFPAKATRTEEEIKKIRDARAKKQMAAETMDVMERAAKAIPGASKAPEPGSVMEAMTRSGKEGTA